MHKHIYVLVPIYQRTLLSEICFLFNLLASISIPGSQHYHTRVEDRRNICSEGGLINCSILHNVSFIIIADGGVKRNGSPDKT